MALLALTKGQLLISIHKMCKENDLLHMYHKKFIRYTVEGLAVEYINIEKYAEKNKKNKIIEDNNYYDVNYVSDVSDVSDVSKVDDIYDDTEINNNYKLNYKK